MANHTFLQNLGVFAVPAFLTPAECARLRNVATAAGGKEAMVYNGEKAVVAEDFRKTLDVIVDDPVCQAIEQRLHDLKPELERHFAVSLGDCDPVRCLVYRPGDFFRLHADTAIPGMEAAKEEFAHLNRRCVTILVYLNEPNHEAEPYEGGALTLFGLMGGAAGKEFGFPVDVETGLLIAFRATTMHEVSPVLSGKRYSLVTWFMTGQQEEE